MAELKDFKRESSLIERAIQKLAQTPAANQAESPTAAPDGARSRSAPPTSRPEHTIPRRVETITDDRDPIPGQQSRKKIQINFQRLESFGVFSPNQGPNRTTEEFRLIKRAVLQNVAQARQEGAKNPNLIMVTSSRQGEGKSFVAFNLAMSMAAESDTSVLLIDADATRSSVLRTLGIQADQGLIDLLRDDRMHFSDVLLKTDIEGLSILPAGPRDPLSTEILASASAANLLEEISKRYADRIIILDAPPVLATSEPSAIALHAGQIVFVVDARSTTKTVLKEALNLIGMYPRLGFVLNRAEFEIGSARFGSYYESYKDSYSSNAKSPRKLTRK
jgi:receptor protein-tyrosine kinase